ncbi:sensor histidine kinase [Kordiimonas gwangyangensis]|uniref:sensor histidine kinase n=1 Tax=Kordiimonas gwangyangensis TaxID=288022 RepID=UPI0003827EBB|nr:HAMP domain-containing sensor histidine kinase [Kordiimonas gwangyangensis]
MTGYLIVALIDIAVALYVLRVSRARAAMAFAFLWSCFGIWLIDLHLAHTIKDVATLTPWFHLMRFGMFCIAPAMILFFTLVTRAEQTNLLKAIIGLSFATSAGLYIANLAFVPSQLVAGENSFSTAPDMLSHIHEANFIFASLFSIALCVHALRTSMFRERRRVTWLVTAIIIGATLGVASFQFSKLFGLAGNVLGLSIMAYALLRHHVITLGHAVNSGMTKALAFVAVAFAFVGLEGLMALSPLSAGEAALMRLVAFFGALEGYPRLVRGIDALRERYFLKPPYNFDFVSTTLLSGLKNASTLSAFQKLSDEVFLRLVKVENYHIDLKAGTFGIEAESGLVRLYGSARGFTHTPEKDARFYGLLGDVEETLFYDEAAPALKEEFALRQASAVVPVIADGQTAGFITLGTPLKTEQFSADDIRLMAWFAREMATTADRLIAANLLEESLNDAEKTLTVVSRLNEYNHDVKTPFSNIEALLLAGDAFTTEEREARILEQVKKGHALVATMTRMLKGQHKRTLTRFNLNEVIEDVIVSYPTQATVVKTALNPLPPIDGYEDELGIMLSNLMSNAFKALDKPRSTVMIETWHNSQTDTIGCRIRDNGVGMDEDRLARLWQSGETGHRTTGGTGVGAGVVKRIVDSHGGSIRVSSEPGVGTEFIITLPAAKRMKPRDAASAEHKASA